MTVRRPEDFKHYEVQLPEVKIHYVREGSGPTLLLLHGWPGFSWEWRKVIGPLSEYYDVVVPDLRGFGDSEKPDLSDLAKYSLERTTDDQAGLLDALGIDQTYVVGQTTLQSSFTSSSAVPREGHKGGDLRSHYARFRPFLSWLPHIAKSWYSQFHQTDMSVELVTSSREACRIYFKHFLDDWSYRPPLLTQEELEIHVDNCMKPNNVHGGFNYYRSNLSVTSDPSTVSTGR